MFFEFALEWWWKLYVFMNEIEIYKFKVHDNILWYKFCLWRVSKDFTKYEISKISKISLNGAVCDFSVDHSATDKEDILSINEYLSKKINIKWCLHLLNRLLLCS